MSPAEGLRTSPSGDAHLDPTGSVAELLAGKVRAMVKNSRPTAAPLGEGNSPVSSTAPCAASIGGVITIATGGSVSFPIH